MHFVHYYVKGESLKGRPGLPPVHRFIVAIPPPFSENAHTKNVSDHLVNFLEHLRSMRKATQQHILRTGVGIYLATSPLSPVNNAERIGKGIYLATSRTVSTPFFSALFFWGERGDVAK